MKRDNLRNPAYTWIKNIKRGDVLRSPSGVFRIVRHVNHNGDTMPRTSVYFAIRRCSWTHRCYTLLTGNDLIQMGYQPVAARFPLKTAFDKAIDLEFDRQPKEPVALDCCAVKGIA